VNPPGTANGVKPLVVVLLPQQYAAPPIATPQVPANPALMGEKVRAAVPVPVAVKVRGLTLASAAAVSVFGPGVVPRRHAACAQPLSTSVFTVTA